MNNLKNLLADVMPLGQIGSGPGFPTTNPNPLEGVSNILSMAVGMLTIIAGLYFMVNFIIGGFEWISAAGDKAKLEKAQQRLTNSTIGLMIVVGAYAVVALLSHLLGIDILLQDTTTITKILTQRQ